MDDTEAREWVEHEDIVGQDDRIARLSWLINSYPSSETGFLINGGWLSGQLLEETKYCFVYGQFLAVAILGFAFIERVLAAQLYGSGRSDLERASGHNLLKEALERNFISEEEFQQFDAVRRLRNPMAHFRRPYSPDTFEYRAVQQDTHPYQIVQSDAEKILKSVLHVLHTIAL